MRRVSLDVQPGLQVLSNPKAVDPDRQLVALGHGRAARKLRAGTGHSYLMKSRPAPTPFERPRRSMSTRTVAKGTQRCMLPAVPEVSGCMNAPGQPSYSRKPPVESEFPSNRRRARRVEISAAHFLSAVTSEDCHLRATLLVQVMIPQVSPLPYEAAIGRGC